MKTTLISLAVATALFAGASGALAQDEKGLTPAVIQQLELVNHLVALGDARPDPLLRLAAASLQKSLGAESVTVPAQSTAPDQILARAKAMSGGKKEINALAAQVGATKSKDASWTIDAVTGQSSYHY